MGTHRAKKGLDLPILGTAVGDVRAGPSIIHVAVMAEDFVGMKPRMAVNEGDLVKRGQLLFENRKAEGVRHTSPAAGKVVAINRGDKRALQSVVIEVSENGNDDDVVFTSYKGSSHQAYSGDDMRALMVESGAWTALRVRPFGHTPAIADVPAALFITATDSNPLAISPELALAGREDDFVEGCIAVSKLCKGPVFLCRREGVGAVREPPASSNIRVENFSGPHPSGTVGFHIHTLFPAGRNQHVWHIGYQDVAALGALIRTGKLDVTRVISVAGPAVKNPCFVKTRVGARMANLTAGNLADGEIRVVSGSVLSGRKASGEVFGYLGMFHNQISAIREDRERHFLGWLAPGFNIFSSIPVYFSKLFCCKKKFDFTTTTHGSHRAMVPIGMYERVMPMDILPTFLLRSLLSDDVIRAEQLGALELDEEDLALCTFVCPGKIDYGPVLRAVLTQIEKEG